MYTAKLLTREIEQGRIKWTVLFTDGASGWKEFFYHSKYEQLQNNVARKLAELNFADSFVLDADIDATIPSEPTKTQAELYKDTWFTDWRNLQNASKLVELGIIADTLPAYVALKAKVTTNFKPAYVPFM